MYVSCSLTRKLFFQYPSGKTWPLIISKNETKNQDDTQHKINVDSWKQDQKEIFDLIKAKQNLNESSSIGGTYNPRQAWQTIDRGRTMQPTQVKQELTYDLQKHGNEKKHKKIHCF